MSTMRRHTVVNGNLVTAENDGTGWVVSQVRSRRTNTSNWSVANDNVWNRAVNSAEVNSVDWNNVPASTLASHN